MSSVRTGHLLLRENDGLVLGRIGYTVCGLGAQPVGHQLQPTNQPASVNADAENATHVSFRGKLRAFKVLIT